MDDLDISVVPDTPQEAWRPVKDSLDYQVSNLGRVRSFIRRSNGPVTDTEGHIMKCGVDRDEYVRVTLRMGGKPKSMNVATLVASAWIGDCPRGYIVYHLDQNKQNNRVDNLVYKTFQEQRALSGKVQYNFHDLTGRKFGRLTVLSRAPSRRYTTWWHCHCDCGNDKEIHATSLTSGKTQSCGCLRRERVSALMTQDLTGRRFGRLIVLGPNGHHPTRKQILVWKCQCDCGKIKDIAGQELRKADTRSCGCLFDETGFEPDRYKALLRYACQAQVYRGKEKGLGFDLSVEDIEALLLGDCFYCGTTGSLTKTDYNRSTKKLISNTILRYNGIDRIDSSLGYLKGNVVSCCFKCNQMKRDVSQEEFKTRIIQIYNHYCTNG